MSTKWKSLDMRTALQSYTEKSECVIGQIYENLLYVV